MTLRDKILLALVQSSVASVGIVGCSDPASTNNTDNSWNVTENNTTTNNTTNSSNNTTNSSNNTTNNISNNTTNNVVNNTTNNANNISNNMANNTTNNIANNTTNNIANNISNNSNNNVSNNMNNMANNHNNMANNHNNMMNNQNNTNPECDTSTATRLPYSGWLDKLCNDGYWDDKRVILCAPPNTDWSCKDGENLTHEEKRKLVEITIGTSHMDTCFAEIYAHDKPACGPITHQGDTCCYTLHINGGQIFVGRPFLVDGEVRFAEIAQREGWMSEITLEHLEGLSQETRDLLAAAWAHDGCHEHASVASFSRFLMQLMWLGAPQDLVTATTRAIDDEIRHAHACFSIASAYAGQPLGPDRVEIAGSMDDAQDIRALLKSVIIEGCIGETLAAAEAEYKLARAIETPARDALEGICKEEGDHAELAWLAVQWILSNHPELMDVARETFMNSGYNGNSPWLVGSEQEDELHLRHGYLRPSLQDMVRRRAFHEIVLPACDQLFMTLQPAPIAA